MRLLIVEDNLLNLKVAKHLLNRNMIDIEILTTQLGKEALKMLEEEVIDIILLDIVMPDINGVEILRTVKSNPNKSDIKVIMFSSLMDKATLKECFEIGASDYITKPIDEVDFIARLKTAIKEKELENRSKVYIEKIKKQNAELVDLNQQLNDTQSQLIQQEKLAAIGHLAAGVAHEINNPLGFVISNYSTLKKYVGKYRKGMEIFSGTYNLYKNGNKINEDVISNIITFFKKNDFEFIDEDIDDLFDDTFSGLDRVKKIVTELRNFSRVNAFEELEVYDLNDGIRNTLVISKNEIKYVANIEADYGKLPEINAVGGQINQVILNLLMNAVAAIKSKSESEMGLLQIKTYADNDYVYLSIKDSGTGIDQEHLNSIFNPFFTTKPVGEGTGLGLSISYDIIVNKHKGLLDVNSTIGEGTEFILGLPIALDIDLMEAGNS